MSEEMNTWQCFGDTFPVSLIQYIWYILHILAERFYMPIWLLLARFYNSQINQNERTQLNKWYILLLNIHLNDFFPCENLEINAFYASINKNACTKYDRNLSASSFLNLWGIELSVKQLYHCSILQEHGY